MISVLLTLLKILGVILLSLLGIFIVLLLLVLFVPIRYQCKGYYKEAFACRGKVTWLLHILSFTFEYDKEMVTSIRILGIPVSLFLNKSKKNDLSTQKIARKESVQKNEGKDTIAVAADKQELKAKDVRKKTETDLTVKPETEKNADAERNELMYSDEDQDKENQTKFKKLCRKIQLIYEQIRSFPNKCRQILAKMRSIFDNIKIKTITVEHYIEILKSDEVKAVFSLCRHRLWIMIKHILPKKLKVVTELGFDDPSTTGYVLALHGMLPGSAGKKIVIHPDFNRAVFVCDFKLKGAVTAWNLLYQVIRVVLDKNCRALYHIIKKEIINERKEQ